LRGFALLGIVLVNVPFLGLTNAGLTADLATSTLDTVVAFLIVALAQGKFYLLFALLFGYGLSIMLRDDTASARAAYLRRLAGLFVLGLAHALLFFIGDILMSYAVLGLALLVLVRRSTRTLIVTAAVSFGVGLAILALIVLDALESGVVEGGIVLDVAAFDAVLATGTFAETVEARALVLPEALIFQIAVNWMPAFAMFALGLAIGRTTLFSEPAQHRRLWWRLVVVGAAVGLPLGAVSAWLQVIAVDPTGVDQVLGVALGFATAPALTASYVGVMALATRTRAAHAFVAAGRTSLSGYLGESIVLAIIFCGWGFALFGAVSVTVAALIAIATWLAIDIAASIWMRRFAYGPFEYVLRWWSTLRRPALMRRSSGPVR
jgi:uncharacterized protein